MGEYEGRLVDCGNCKFYEGENCQSPDVRAFMLRLDQRNWGYVSGWLHRCDFFALKEPPKVKCGECKYGSVSIGQIGGLDERVIQCWHLDTLPRFNLASYPHPCERYESKVVKDA